jgi:hypothetical protein
MQVMAREKATISLDRGKATLAQSLTGSRSLSEVIDRALDYLVEREQARRHLAGYLRHPQTADEIALSELSVTFDLDDDDIDYEAMYGDASDPPRRPPR